MLCHLLKMGCIRAVVSKSEIFFKIPELFCELSEVLPYKSLALRTSSGIPFFFGGAVWLKVYPTPSKGFPHPSPLCVCKAFQLRGLFWDTAEETSRLKTSYQISGCLCCASVTIQLLSSAPFFSPHPFSACS